MLDRYAGNFRYGKGEDGAQRIVSNARSEFDGKRSSNFEGQYKTKQFGKKDAEVQKPWWGTREYATSRYSGPTDGSRFQQDSILGNDVAGESGKVSRDTGRSYRTGVYQTGAAHEASARPVEKRADALTESKRDNQVSPRIVGWEQQRQLQMSETKSLLGRE